MVFNSLEFFIFLPTVFFLYWVVLKNHVKAQNILVLVASYIFYGMWDWRFLSLILLSTIVDYVVGINIYKHNVAAKRKLWIWVSVVFNIGLLGFFKYYNFFVDSWVHLFSSLGYTFKSTWTLRVILPVGISFYTFQTLSYSLDIYYKKLKPTTDFLSFATFVSFFPQLVAGPIERASNLMSQIISKRTFNYNQIVSGLKLILWGLFKKIVIADALGPIVDDIFFNYNAYPASTLILGVTLFSFQIYGDFSGYSDIAIGTSKLFGIELMSNFKYPNFARNVAEYWQRWHISLSNWFRHYLYIPLGGSRGNRITSLRNICIIFLVSGLWHGANWTFVFWGAFHAIAFIPVFLLGKNAVYKDTVIAQHTLFPTVKEIAQVLITFALVTFSRIFFRSESLSDAFAFISRLGSQFTYQTYIHPLGYRMIDYYILIILFVVYEYIIRKDERAPFKFKSKFVRFAMYTIVILAMLLFYDSQVDRSFIYFQF
ncbi:MBOAT family protein [Formosa sediminum]|uniref:MBOAT family protein n=1 Tax=Formosa sediminum TaxID=2594004 RepID=A0A516GT66_9FLAO|nr:MBOAT family O-acyltransferase [Formosa sediminum]QDO94699.1 MBOAT family protein [Formosa sediminum]